MCGTALQLGCASKPGFQAASSRASSTVVVHGHRGDRGNVPPGNTLPSFRSALGYGVDVLEGDLQITADGSVVFGHDDDLRTTGCKWAGEGPAASALVSALKDTELAQWDCDPAREGIEAPPHLHEVLALDRRVGLNLELKRSGTQAADVVVRALIAEDDACGGCLAPRLIVQSFDWDDLEHVHVAYAEAFDVRLSLLAEGPRDDLAEAARFAQIWSPHQDLATRDTIAQAHAMGLQVAPWTVNDEAAMLRLIDAGVDAIITDVPDVLLRVLGR